MIDQLVSTQILWGLSLIVHCAHLGKCLCEYQPPQHADCSLLCAPQLLLSWVFVWAQGAYDVTAVSPAGAMTPPSLKWLVQRTRWRPPSCSSKIPLIVSYAAAVRDGVGSCSSLLPERWHPLCCTRHLVCSVITSQAVC